MTLEAHAQELIVLEPIPDIGHHNMSMLPIEVVDEPSHEHVDMSPMEVSEPGEVSIIIDGLPGATEELKDFEPVLEVEEEEEDKKEDENEAKTKKPEKWDWASRGSTGFIVWVKERIDDVPRHSGNDITGIQRCISYLEKVDAEISKAMRMDIDGELDANKIEEVRTQIENGIDKLNDRADKIKQSKKKLKKKKGEEDRSDLVKEAKIAGISGIVITVPLLISRIARVCINGTVSGGHSLEDMFQRQVKKYKLNDREQVEVVQLLEDLGMPLRQDRGYLPDEGFDDASSDNFDLGANYGN